MSDRYFLDHGMIHDRKTGKHITTDDTMQRGGTLEVLALLNEYEAAQPVAQNAYRRCVADLVRQVALMMDDCEEHADGRITIDCDISQGFLRRIYDLLSALEDCGYDAMEAQPSVVPEWVSVKDRQPPRYEPVVYSRPNPRGGWHVGIAYWTVSKKWSPEANSEHAPNGFTHWMPLPDKPCSAVLSTTDTEGRKDE